MVMDSTNVNIPEDITHSNSSSKLPFPQLETFAQELYMRAPAYFLQSKTKAELDAIAQRSHKLLLTFLSSDQPCLVEARIQNEICTLVVVVSDRPFIVNTITALLRSFFQIRTSVHLHPIISLRADRKLSVNYLELPLTEAHILREIEARLKDRLQDLILASDDHLNMLLATENLARVFEQSAANNKSQNTSLLELKELLRWLSEGNFVFFGILHSEQSKDNPEVIIPTTRMGIARSKNSELSLVDKEILSDLKTLKANFCIQRLSVRSTIHRSEHILHIGFCVPLSNKNTDKTASSNSYLSILGTFTSQALAQEPSSVPLIRRTLKEVLHGEKLQQNSHDYKNAANILDNIPKELALSLEFDDILNLVRTVSNAQLKPEVKITIQADHSGRSAWITLIVPYRAFSDDLRRRAQTRIEALFGAALGSAQEFVSTRIKPLAILSFHVPCHGHSCGSDISKQLEESIIPMTKQWTDRLSEKILSSYESSEAMRINKLYSQAFPKDYQATQEAETGILKALKDISQIEQLSEQDPIKVAMYTDIKTSTTEFTLSVYCLTEALPISQALPVFENAGLYVLSERSSKLTPENGIVVHLHQFLVRRNDAKNIDSSLFESYLAPGLVATLLGRSENDILNSLWLSAQLSVREVTLVRSFYAYLWQIIKFASRSTIMSALSSSPDFVKKMVEAFDQKFNPNLDLTIDQRKAKTLSAISNLRESLWSVSDITQDRILRMAIEIFEHTIRTNYFTKYFSDNKGPLAHKLHSEKIECLPLPRPMFEIFVYSSRVEGVHLRAGKVARGGLRWSERKEDYRYEVLGLMNTQSIKNSLIVPTGAKGGFIVKRIARSSDQMPNLVEESYQEFVSALLSITDNIINDKVSHPNNVLAFDGEDPYFVVAADKGTAKFSDLANNVAKTSCNFWLGDAFASGGSNGYDHKLYGITARGAWETTKRHFHDLGIDYQSTPFTVIGIGDMSGDVFGNGLLMSQKMKLLAAFNHAHIFVDPNPDPTRSFEERKRLFNLPRSQWSDYDQKIISKGGAVYTRSQKEIKLSPEARSALGIHPESSLTMSGEELVAHILKAPCDLLWNGGIGTYIKSRTETNAQAQDSVNDGVRVDADQVAARIIAEGGNLGLTQRARIDFSLKGGRCNTDAIDNSGGVDLSDHEVNIKILFAELIKQGKVTLEERNKILKEMADDVCELVLDDNRSHALVLTLSAQRSTRKIDHFRTLIRDLVGLGYVNRQLQQLPDDDELLARAKRKQGLTRPELAVLCSTVKMWLKDIILKSDLPEDPGLQSYLLGYFPDALTSRFADQIYKHPLRREIIATQIVNNLVDSMGVSFAHRISHVHSITPLTTIKAYLAAKRLLEARKLRRKLSCFDTPTHVKFYLESLQMINTALTATIAWFVSYHDLSRPIDQLVQYYADSGSDLVTKKLDLVFANNGKTLERNIDRLRSLGIDDLNSHKISSLPETLKVLAILWCSKESGASVQVSADVYSEFLRALNLEAFLDRENAIEPSSSWDGELLYSSMHEIRRSIVTIVKSWLASDVKTAQACSERISQSNTLMKLKNLVQEANAESPSVAQVAVLAQRFAAAARL